MENAEITNSIQLQKLRIYIDREWTTTEFVMLFKSIENLYGLYRSYFEGLEMLEEKNNSTTYFVDEHHTPMFHFRDRNPILRSFYNQEGIFETKDYPFFIRNDWKRGPSIVSIKYSSPGFTDIAGIGEVIRHLKEILLHYFPNKIVKEEIKLKEQERIKIQIENLKQMGFNSIEIQKIILLEEMNLEKIRFLMQEGLIASIELNEN